MAKFFVGQRVRLVRPKNPSNYGLTGRITIIRAYVMGDILPNGKHFIGESAECWLEFDQCRRDETGDSVGASLFERLEPILPEGAQPSEFSFTELMDNLGVVVA